MHTAAPRCAKRSAIPRPMPRAPPVTTATWLLQVIAGFPLAFWRDSASSWEYLPQLTPRQVVPIHFSVWERIASTWPPALLHAFMPAEGREFAVASATDGTADAHSKLDLS